MANQVVIEYKAELGKIKAQLKELEKNLKGAEDQAKKTDEQVDKINKTGGLLQNQMKKLGAAIAAAFATQKIIEFTVATVNAASDLNETLSKTQQIFGDSATEIERWSRTSAQAFGQSQTQAMEAASTFAIFGKAAGLAGEDLVKFSTDFVALASDLASFNNTSPEDAILAIGAALRGESEPIRRYGVLLNEATLRQEALELGIIKTTKEALTPQQRALAAQAAIYKQTTDAQGDFARTSDGLANSQRILTAQFVDLQAAIGQELLPTATAAIKVLNEMAQGFLFLLNGIDAAEQAQIDAAFTDEQVFIEMYKRRIDMMDAEGRLDELRDYFVKRNLASTDEVMTKERAYELMLVERQTKLQEQANEYERLAEVLGNNYIGQLDYNVSLGITEEQLAAVTKALQEYRKQVQGGGEAAGSAVRTLKAMQEEIKTLQGQLLETEVGTEAFYALQQQIEQLQKEYKAFTEGVTASSNSLAGMNERIADLQKRLSTTELGTQAWNDLAFEIGLAKRELAEYIAFQTLLEMGINTSAKSVREFSDGTLRNAEQNKESIQVIGEEYDSLGRVIDRTAEGIGARLATQVDASKERIEQFNKDNEEAAEIFRANTQLTADAALIGMAQVQQGFSALASQFIADEEKRAEFEKDMAIFTIFLSTAAAIANTIAEASKVPFPGNIAAIATGIGVVLSNMAQAVALSNQASTPKFAEGGWVGGKSHADGGIMIEAEKGEYIINRRDAAANKDILKAINTGNLSKYVVRHYVEPLARSMAADKNSLADNIAASLAEQMTSQNGYLRRMSKGVNINNLDKLAKMLQQPNVNKMRH